MKKQICILLSLFLMSLSYGKSSYCSYPPFLANTVKPNVLIMLDNSGSMKTTMYEQSGIQWNKSCEKKPFTNFNPDEDYYGIFDSNKTYSYNPDIPVDPTPYSGYPYDVNIDTTVKGAFVEDSCNPRYDDNCWDGNFLNWLVTRRIDAARMVLIGGKVESRNGYDYDNDGEKEWKILGNNEPIDFKFCKTYSSTEDFTPFESATFEIYSPADDGKVKDIYDPYEKIIVKPKFPINIENSWGSVIGEIGTIRINHKWKKVKLKNSYTNPIVVAKSLSYNGTNPSTVRIRNVTSDSFEIRIQEWNYLDEFHLYETVSYIVVEQGKHTLPGGIVLRADKIETNKFIDVKCKDGETTQDWEEVRFESSFFSFTNFSKKPIVITSITTENGKDAVTTRLKDITKNGFKVTLEEEEKLGGHSTEEVSYIAVEPGNIKINDDMYLYIDEEPDVKDEFKEILSPKKGKKFVAFIADMQTTNDLDTAVLRYDTLDREKILVKVEEETSCDKETKHTYEDVGFIALLAEIKKYNVALVVEEEPKGILHDIYNKVRLGISFYNYKRDTSNIYNPNKLDGGTLRFYIPKNPFIKDPRKDKGYRVIEGYIGTSLDEIIDSIEHYPLVWGTTPIAENLWEVIQYFEQDDPYYFNTDFELATNTTPERDPYYFPEYKQKVRCAKSFVLIFTDGEPYKDANIPCWLVDYDEDSKTCSNCKKKQNCDCCSKDPDAWGHNNLDDVAYWAYWNKNKNTYRDLRDDLEGEQNLTTYTVGFAGYEIRQILKDTANNGGGKAYAAGDGNALKEAILDAINDILKKTASSTAVSAFAEKTKKGALAIQAVFYPEKKFKNYQTTWIGYLYSYWLYNKKTAQNLREDTDKNKILSELDNIIEFSIDSSGTLKIYSYEPNLEGRKGTLDKIYTSLDEVPYVWEAGEKLKERDPDTRKIYTVSEKNSLVEFQYLYSSYFDQYLGDPDTFPACLGYFTSSKKENLIDYIRGKEIAGCRSREINDLGDNWKLADIVYSTPIVVNYPEKGYSVVYTGSNGGILHAFKAGYLSKKGLSENQIVKLQNSKSDAGTDQLGEELWGFIPKNVLPYLRYLPDPDYCHMYFVDLTPYVFDYKDRKILIGGMRLGGACGCDTSNCVKPPTDTCPKDGECVGLSSYFALDITDPENPKFMWEFTDKDLGFSFSGPGIIKKKNRTYVLFASGPTDYQGNSDQNLKLFIVDLDTGNLVATFDRFNGGYGIGEGGPIANAFGGRLFTKGLDYDEDETTDYIIFGYVNKNGKNWDGGLIFGDVREEYPGNWNFIRYLEDTRPIVAKVEIMKCFNNWYAYFGTGRWFYKTDESSLAKSNLLYGIYLECSKTKGCHPNLNFAHGSSEACSSTSKLLSWKIELEKTPENYFPERLITDPSTTDKNVIVMVTMEPSGDICGFGGRTRVWALNCATGGALSEDCANYPISSVSGKILLQLSGGDIQDITLENFKNSSTPKRVSEWMQGTPPPASSPVVPPAKDEKAKGEILLWLEK